MSNKWWLEAKRLAKPDWATRLRPHSPSTMKGVSKPVCSLCGLIYLNNDATRHAIKRGCWKAKDE